jgi:protein involved in polysaccharide export with SLBB domain
VVLEGGDELEIPLRPSAVTVLGMVYNPNSFVFQPGHDIGWYLDKTGGPVADAEKSEMYVIRSDGTVQSRQQSFFGSFLSSSLDAGDTLVVPQKLERIAWLREIKDWTQILANVALTAGTVMLGLR